MVVSGWKHKDTHAQKEKYIVTCSAHSTQFKDGSENNGFFCLFSFPFLWNIYIKTK